MKRVIVILEFDLPEDYDLSGDLYLEKMMAKAEKLTSSVSVVEDGDGDFYIPVEEGKFGDG